MSEGTKESMASGVFTVGNYFFGGVGHVSVDYGKVLKMVSVVSLMKLAVPWNH